MGKLITLYQKTVLYFCYFIFNCLFSIFKKSRNKRQRDIVIGVKEIANVLFTFKKIFKSVYVVNLFKNKYYNNKYDFKPCSTFRRILVGPILLAYLSNVSDIFMYNWTDGFCYNREVDLKFLKRINKKILFIFMGTDIRSPRKYKELNLELGIEDTFIDYISIYNNRYASDTTESEKKKVSNQADTFGDIIFNDSIDQISYIKSKQYPWPTVVDINDFDENKDFDINNITILHGPSNPVIKGTPIVRSVIKKLKTQGYKFNYKELIGVPHDEMLEELNNATIVINELYAHVPGVFGVEALASGCALITSASREYNTNLPDIDGWVSSQYWELYDKLKMLLDDDKLLAKYLKISKEVVMKFYSIESSKKYYRDVIKREIGYDITV